MRGRILSLILAAGAIAGWAGAHPAPSVAPAHFRHLQVRDGVIVSEAPIAYRIAADRTLRPGASSHRIAEFGDHPFEVSMAAFVGPDSAVMVHAERVADGSGRSNYDHLPAAAWPDGRFRVRRQCAVIDREAAQGEHDLVYLAREGLNPVGSLVLEQYFTTTPDHNREVVISLVARVADCATEADNQAALDRLRNRVRVMPAG